jgi:hypothetical protein
MESNSKYYNIALSAGFTYRLDRLKPRASKFRGPPAKVYNIYEVCLKFCNILKWRATV